MSPKTSKRQPTMIQGQRDDYVMTHILKLKWGEGIPVLRSAKYVNDPEEMYVSFAEFIISKMRDYGIPDDILPSQEEFIKYNIKTREVPERQFYLGRYLNGERNEEAYYGFGHFCPAFYHRLGEWETIEQYSIRTNINKSTAFAYWR